MTRLRTEDIEHIRHELKAYDQQLLDKTGKTLKAIAAHAAGQLDPQLDEIIKSSKVCVVPMTCGLGVIDNFSDTVCEIISHLGFDSFTAQNSDAAGIAEAFEKESDVIVLADDNRFIAINVHTKYVSDNSEMTAKGFVAALDLMAAGLKGKNALLLGCGEVGSHAARILVTMGVAVTVCDIDGQLALILQKDIADTLKTTIEIDDNWRRAPEKYPYIIDATPTGDLINASAITPDSCVAVPGVPCGLTADAEKKLSNRYIHDPLQIGVATMVIDACKQ
jgi:pyrrolysine biosynthesis protein PylD